MSLDRLFETVEQARETANWQSAFGEPQVVEDKTVIPVAKVGYGFGLGFGSGQGPAGEEGELTGEGEGGGVGGGASATPMGAIVVTPEKVYYKETPDTTKIATAGTAVGALFLWQLFKTLRAIFAGR